ncbi:hypothetical protein PENTCL1PPCAC_12696, partial [Pristionchus entomophagus]
PSVLHRIIHLDRRFIVEPTETTEGDQFAVYDSERRTTSPVVHIPKPAPCVGCRIVSIHVSQISSSVETSGDVNLTIEDRGCKSTSLGWHRSNRSLAVSFGIEALTIGPHLSGVVTSEYLELSIKHARCRCATRFAHGCSELPH